MWNRRWRRFRGAAALVVLLLVGVFHLRSSMSSVRPFPGFAAKLSEEARVSQSSLDQMERSNSTTSRLIGKISTDAVNSSEAAAEKTSSGQIAPPPSSSPQPTMSYIASVVSQKNTDVHEIPLCTREDIIQGEWVPITLPAIPYVPHDRCLPDDNYKTGRPWETWEWQPIAAKENRCSFERWDAARLCSLARFTTIAIVGDSLSWEHYVSLVQLMGHLIAEQHQHDSRSQGKIIFHYVCGGQVRLVFFRDDELKEISKVVNTTSPSVLVINRGAHYTHESLLREDLSRVIATLQDWQDHCKVSQRQCQLLVRTTVPGHPHCWNFTRPVKNVTEMEAYISDQSNYAESQRHFYWYDFQRQNILSLEMYQQANLSYKVLDGYYINILRPDGHKVHAADCLHSCFPGKMDLYNQLMMHFLETRGGVAASSATWISDQADSMHYHDLHDHLSHPILCTRDQIQQGVWIPVNMSERPYSSHAPCSADGDYQAGQQWETWDWQPSAVKDRNCTLLSWNASHFCSLVRFATIAVVGESTSSWEQFASLLQLLGGNMADSYFFQLGDGQIMIQYACLGQVRLVFCRDDNLEHIVRVVDQTSPQVLILGPSAGNIDDKSLTSRLQRVTVELSHWYENFCEILQRRCHVMVRTTVPRHPQCQNFTKPAVSKEEMISFLSNQSSYVGSRLSVNFRDLQRQNSIVTSSFQAGGLRFPLDIIDGFDINILRPDQYRGGDCLSSCFPGKLDVFNQLLLHFLQLKGAVSNSAPLWLNMTSST